MPIPSTDRRHDAHPDDLIGEIYGAATDPGRWGPLLERLCVRVGGRLAFVASYNLATGRGRLLHTAHVGAAEAERFADLYALPAAWVRSGDADPLLVEDVAARAAEADGAFYARWLDPAASSELLQALVTREPVRTPAGPEVVFVAVARDRAAGALPASEVERLAGLVPHFRRANEIGATVAGLEARWQAAMDSFDKLGIGVVILDGEQRPLGMNRYARELVALRNGKPLEALAPIIFSGEQGAVSMRACGLIGAAAPSQAMAGLGAVAVLQGRHHNCESSAARPIIAAARRLDTAGRDCVRGMPATVVFLSDPERKGLLEPETVRRLYGLTRAEANIAVMLAEGRNLDQAADELDISINTVRTHLKRVLEKTNTTRQADLVRLLLNPCTQIRA